jgi:sulfoxide reductase heme-binding subunit YedZ
MIHAIAIALATLPALTLAAGFWQAGPGPNPIEDITHLTGRWGLRLILLSLAITPARRFFGWKAIAPLRRTLGLAGFSYAVLHLLTWCGLDLGLGLGAILEDLTERPFVMAGMGSFTLLLCLAITSTKSSMRRLGKHWARLHQVVYIAATLAVVHHFWLTKADYRPAIIHAVVLAALLGARLVGPARRPPRAS